MQELSIPLPFDNPEESLKDYAKKAFTFNFDEIYSILENCDENSKIFKEEVLDSLLTEKVDDKMIILLIAMINWPTKNLIFNTENLDKNSLKILLDLFDCDNTKNKKYKVQTKRRRVETPIINITEKFQIKNYREKLKIKKMKPFILYLLLQTQLSEACGLAGQQEILYTVLEMYEFQMLHNPLAKFLSNLVLANGIGFADAPLLTQILFKLMDCLQLEDIGTNTPFNKKSSEFDLQIFESESNESLEEEDLEKEWFNPGHQRTSNRDVKREILDLIFQEKNQRNFEENQQEYFLSTHHLILYCLWTLGTLNAFPGGPQEYFRYTLSFVKIFRGLIKMKIPKEYNFKEKILLEENIDYFSDCLKDAGYSEEAMKVSYMMFKHKEGDVGKDDQFVKLLGKVITNDPHAQISLRVYCWLVSLIKDKGSWDKTMKKLMKRIKVLEIPPCRLKWLRKYFKNLEFDFCLEKNAKHFIEDPRLSQESTQSQEQQREVKRGQVLTKVEEPPILFVNKMEDYGKFEILFLKKKSKKFKLEILEELSQTTHKASPGKQNVKFYKIEQMKDDQNFKGKKRALKFQSDHNIYIRNNNIRNAFFSGIFKKNFNYMPINYGSKIIRQKFQFFDFPLKNPTGGKLVFWAPRLDHEATQLRSKYFDYVCFYDTNFENFCPSFTRYLERFFIRINKRTKKRLITSPLTTSQGPNSLYIGRDNLVYRIFVSDNFFDFENNKQLEIYPLREKNSIGTLKYFSDEEKSKGKAFNNGFLIVHNWILIERQGFLEIYEVIRGLLIKRLEIPLENENFFYKAISSEKMIFAKIQVKEKMVEDVESGMDLAAFIVEVKGMVVDFGENKLKKFGASKEIWEAKSAVHIWNEFIIDVFEDLENEEVVVLYNVKGRLEGACVPFREHGL
jgi:hypothetical protein